jgi:hypothetical protein
VREHFLEALARDWPEHVERYEALFATRAYLPTSLAAAITEPARKARVSLRYSRLDGPIRPEPRQLALAV